MSRQIQTKVNNLQATISKIWPFNIAEISLKYIREKTKDQTLSNVCILTVLG